MAAKLIGTLAVALSVVGAGRRDRRPARYSLTRSRSAAAVATRNRSPWT